jgi:hypothetical protein
MNVREYVGGAFLRPDDIGETPVTLTIVDVAPGKFDKLDLTFADGSKLSLNATNGKTLARAWGYESSAWLDKQVEARVGQVTFQGEPQKSILLKPVSPAMSARELALVKPAEPDPVDDIPFNRCGEGFERLRKPAALLRP